MERRADGICHDIRNRLSAAFITPIDQEDILHLAQLLDDVTDALDEVALECYMFRLAGIAGGRPRLRRADTPVRRQAVRSGD